MTFLTLRRKVNIDKTLSELNFDSIINRFPYSRLTIGGFKYSHVRVLFVSPHAHPSTEGYERLCTNWTIT